MEEELEVIEAKAEEEYLILATETIHQVNINNHRIDIKMK